MGNEVVGGMWFKGGSHRQVMLKSEHWVECGWDHKSATGVMELGRGQIYLQWLPISMV